MYTLVLSVHIILAVALVGLVLLQQGKGADVGAVVTGGGANSLFGVGGASSLLVRMTTGVAVAFMFTSILLVRFAGEVPARSGADDAMSGSVFEGEPAVAPQAPDQQAPNQPAAAVSPAVDAAASTPAATAPVVVPAAPTTAPAAAPAATAASK